MLILITHANHLYADRKQARKMQPYPPLQALIAASVLRRQGHRVAFFDTTFDREFRAALDKERPDLIAVCEDNFNFLTKMCLLANRELAFEIAREARARGIPAVVNSSDATDHAREYLEAGFDRVVLGELEWTLVELCSWGRPAFLEKGGPGFSGRLPGDEVEPSRRAGSPPQAEGLPHIAEDSSPISGCAWLSATGAVEYGPPRAAISQLDDLPAPAWDLVDIERYREAWVAAHGRFSLNLVASRGCPYHCNWCAKPIYGDGYRYHSADRIAAEIECVKDLFAPDEIWFADDIFGLSGKWTQEFAACVERRGARVPFRMQSRCDLMTRDTVDALARAGCFEVWMGAESGSQRILDAMEKGIRVQDVYEARENLRRHGIRACYFLQFGYLGEEQEDVDATIRMVRETRPDDIGVSVSYPLPNTRFHQIVRSRMGSQENWHDSADMPVMFQSAYSSDFYRALSAALHLEVRNSVSAAELSNAWEKVEQLRCVSC